VINGKNLLLIAVLVVLNAVAFLWGQYYILVPVIYISGFIGMTIISFWFGNQLETKDLIFLAVSSTVLAFFDEYAHCSAGTLSYFDGGVPSLLTVFGWIIFMISILAITKLITKIQPIKIPDSEMLRTIPVVVTLISLATIVVVQDYLSIFNWCLILVYLFLFAASFYYTHVNPLKWNIILMTISLILGITMEYIGRLEGLWTFRFQDPISYLILFSWPLRIWAVTAVCYAFEVDFSKDQEKEKIEPSEELDPQKSIMVVADTHLGLKKEKQNCDPQAVSDFLHWVESLEKKGKDYIKLGKWGVKSSELTVKPPEKMVFLGDILEMWDTTKEAVDVCSRLIIQTLSKLSCKKIYVLGNHDHELATLSGEYPMGQSSVNIIENEYATSKGDKKLVFLHGHQFDKLFEFPSWRVMPLFNRMATVFGDYMLIFVALFVLNLLFMDWDNGLGYITLIGLGALAVPFIIVKSGRAVWNRLKTTKYKPQEAENGIKKWWNKIEKTVSSKETNVIYGHTHTIGFRSIDIGKYKLTLFNLPSWIIDTKCIVAHKYVEDKPQDNTEETNDSTSTDTESSPKMKEVIGEVSLEELFRHGFLYVDDEIIAFMGWDTEAKKPFFVPRDIVQERQEGDLRIYESNEEYDNLLQIGWPQKLIEKWFNYKFPEASLS
jgi:UDP-2,3-diacylglucosamine pyrophosphatase LpxH